MQSIASGAYQWQKSCGEMNIEDYELREFLKELGKALLLGVMIYIGIVLAGCM